MQYETLAPFLLQWRCNGANSKCTISRIIFGIIRSNKNYNTLETFVFHIKLVSLKVKILSEGTFSHVVAHMILWRTNDN